MRSAQGLLGMLSVLLLSQVAAAATVNFDDLTFPEAISYGAADRYRSSGVVFATDIPLENVAVFEPQNYAAFLSAGGTAPNGLGLNSSTVYSIDASFAVPGTVYPGTTDWVQVWVFDSHVGSNLGVLVAYDQDYNLIDSSTRTTPSSMGGTLEIWAPDIAHVQFRTDTDGAVFDNLRFNTPTGPTATDETTWGRLKALYR